MIVCVIWCVWLFVIVMCCSCVFCLLIISWYSIFFLISGVMIVMLVGVLSSCSSCNVVLSSGGVSFVSVIFLFFGFVLGLGSCILVVSLMMCCGLSVSDRYRYGVFGDVCVMCDRIGKLIDVIR